MPLRTVVLLDNLSDSIGLWMVEDANMLIA